MQQCTSHTILISLLLIFFYTVDAHGSGLFEKSKLQFRRDVIFTGKSDKSVVHEVIFVIAPKNMDKLEAVLLDVSNPKSPKYGQHWSRQQVEDLTHNKEGHDLVINFLMGHDIHATKESKYGNFIYASAQISKWESIFSSEFHSYRVKHLNETINRCLSVSLPHQLHPHLQGIFNTVQLPSKWGRDTEIVSSGQKFDEIAKVDSSSGKTTYPGYVYPGLINQYYNVTNNTASFLVSQAVYESLNQQMSPSDLEYFQNYFNLPLQPLTRDIGGNAHDPACVESVCGEANLDVQYLMGIAQHANTTFWYTNDWMFGWILAVGDSDYPSDVYSISYGGHETGLESSYTSSFNNEAMKLGTMGVTLLAASGDAGAPGSIANQGTKYCGYNPEFPASSPYVTTVGATMGPQSETPEVGCQAAQGTTVLITSGGGFSTHFIRPSWQKSAVETYFATVDNTPEQPYEGTTAIEYDVVYEYSDYIKIPTYFNASGRGYPDVALLGHNYMVVVGGNIIGVDGTSASTPVFAAFVTLANHQRVLAGAPKMGFLNPFLYQNAKSFVHDITSGNNKCTQAYSCTSSGCKVHCCNEGFYAAAGWDPMTGLGSVSYRNFVETALSVVGVGAPTLRPSLAPTTFAPSESHVPTHAPTHLNVPTHAPTKTPSVAPSEKSPPMTSPPFTLPPDTRPPSRLPTAVPKTIAPTISPTFAPSTRSPTSDFIGIEFNVYQIITGVSMTAYETYMASNNLVVSETVSSFVPGTTTATVTVLSVVDSTLLASAMSTMKHSIVEQLSSWLGSRASFNRIEYSSTSSINVTYSVAIPNIFTANYPAPTSAFDSSKQDLIEAVISGKFTTLLNSNAVTQGNSNLNTATVSVRPAFTNYTTNTGSIQTNSGGSSATSKFSAIGGIAGIAGIAAGLVVICGAFSAFVFYYYCYNRSSTNYAVGRSTVKSKFDDFHFDNESGRISELTAMGPGNVLPVVENVVENPIIHKQVAGKDKTISAPSLPV